MRILFWCLTTFLDPWDQNVWQTIFFHTKKNTPRHDMQNRQNKYVNRELASKKSSWESILSLIKSDVFSYPFCVSFEVFSPRKRFWFIEFIKFQCFINFPFPWMNELINQNEQPPINHFSSNYILTLIYLNAHIWSIIPTHIRNAAYSIFLRNSLTIYSTQ